MNFEQRCVIPATREQLWRFLMDVPEMATCVPGVENVTADGKDTYRGVLKVRLGPISLALNGTITIQERDEANWRAVGRGEASDRRVGGGTRVNATMHLIEKAPGETEMVVQAEVRFLGKLGEFGEPLIRKQADATVAAFARNVAARFAPPPGMEPSAEAPAPPIGQLPHGASPAGSAYPWIGAAVGIIVAIALIAFVPLPLLSSGWWAKIATVIVLAGIGAIFARLACQPVSERKP